MKMAFNSIHEMVETEIVIRQKLKQFQFWCFSTEVLFCNQYNWS